MSSTQSQTKLILVIGATGAQGSAVIDKLLEPIADGTPSSYSVRALTRDPDSRRANQLKSRGIECVKGAFDDFDSVRAALQGVYGVYVNTDGFTVGQQKEIFAGIRIFEIAKEVGTVKHYVWSNLDYALKLGGWDPKYNCDHANGKGIVGDWMRAQESVINEYDSGMTWSMVTIGPYMDMLFNAMLGPLKRREDGTFVFPTPIGNGHIPMVALEDIGFFARYAFDNRAATSGQELLIASDIVSWEYLRTTFEKVTGQKAEVLYLSIDEWMKIFAKVDYPVATERTFGDGSTTWRQNFTAWAALLRDDIVKRDLEWIRRIHPNGYTLEKWMREKQYTGKLKMGADTVLKNTEDGKAVSLDREFIKTL